jgi:hypothetical protein
MSKMEYLTERREHFQNYDRAEMDDLLWEMYKGWFLHYATEVDTDKIIDMMLFYDELRDVIAKINPAAILEKQKSLNRIPFAVEKDIEQP